ncbi:MAG: uncharacterized protein A8A55_3275 [Amphiamblys sp. WSBS2006]|nr:MAG: uncharacterized protein A8A55_3275 [Amphiamblys sp. WSBS2006]
MPYTVGASTAKEFQFDLEAASDIHEEEENRCGLKIPYGISLLISEEGSSQLKSFDLTDTRIKRLVVCEIDITKICLKNTIIEELFLMDGEAIEFFYSSIEGSEFRVEKLSFGCKLNHKSKRFLKLIGRVRGGENVALGQIQRLVLSRNNFFGFLEEASRTSQKKYTSKSF